MELKKREEIIKEIQSLIIALKANGGWAKRTNGEGWFNHEILEDALALIKELSEEIKDLEADYERVYEQAEADIRGNMADGGTSCHWCADKTKADTVKRMQEKLNAEVIKRYGKLPGYIYYIDVIDMVAKELLEENK